MKHIWDLIKDIIIGMLVAFAIIGAITFVFAAEPEDKDLTILRLQKIIAEQSMARLLENERVMEYERIKTNYQRLIAEIAVREKNNEQKK